MTAHRMPGVGSSPIDRETGASNTDAMSLKHTFAGLLGAATIAVSVPAGAAGSAAPPVPRPLGNIHGCGVLAVPAHPWRSHVDGGTDESGDHWIVDAQGTHWSCSFARAEIQRLIGLGPRRYAGRDVGHLAFIDPDPTFIHAAPREVRR